MEQALGVIAGRLEAVERQPALQVSGVSLGAELNAAARETTNTLSGSVSGVASEMRNVTATLGDLVRRIHDRREQEKTKGAVAIPPSRPLPRGRGGQQAQ